MTMTERQFVELVARQDPITPFEIDGVNTCKFCKAHWAEDNYDLYLANHVISQRQNHHDYDCLWVVANSVARSNSA